MNFQNKIDFCIIHAASVAGAKPMIFFSHHKVDEMTEEIWQSKDYVHLKKFVEDLGFLEIDYGVFESKTTSGNFSVLTETFFNAGLNYSKPLEDNVRKSFNMIMADAFKNHQKPYQLPVVINNQPAIAKTKEISVVDGEFKFPKKGEKITIYFYMFLQIMWTNENDFIADFSGDMNNKHGNGVRNYLGIFKGDFVRTDFDDVPFLQFESVKTHKDFMEEIDFLYRGLFVFEPRYTGQPKSTYSYNIMEVKKHIRNNAQLIVQIGKKEFQENILLASNRIEEEYKGYMKEKFDLNKAKNAAFMLKEKLEKKMKAKSEEEDYEKASVLKNSITFINEKIKKMISLDKEKISRKQYLKLFGIKE
jgi:hypothetical protein